MKPKRKLLLRLTVLTILLSIYPLSVLTYTWTCVFRSDLEGGRNGPLDAYRHTLASAVVSYTLHPRAVDLITTLMEAKGKDSNKMDRHNNRIGAQIGATSKSFRDLEPVVRQSVQNGTINSTNTTQITWLKNGVALEFGDLTPRPRHHSPNRSVTGEALKCACAEQRICRFATIFSPGLTAPRSHP